MTQLVFARKASAFVLILLFSCNYLFSQDSYQVTEALAAKTGYNYGREAIYTDKLAYQLFTGQMKTPVEGESIELVGADSTVVWQTIKSDSTNRLFVKGTRREFLRGGGTYFFFTYNSDKDRAALINIQGSSAFFLNDVLHAGDPYAAGWLNIPVQLKKGVNEFLVRGYAITAKLDFPAKQIKFETGDLTLPSIVDGEDNSQLFGGIVIVNTSKKEMSGLEIDSYINGKTVSTKVPSIPATGMRKVAFRINGSGLENRGDVKCAVVLKSKGKMIDSAHVNISAPEAGKQYTRTFISKIDGSVQYYAVTPQIGGNKPGNALFLSVHGAGVEAISQARAYKSKDWGTLVAPTNRRPRGFNWEDWGRIDALEVLEIARERFRPASDRLYLTGHSMGGHGTWFLGATYPDKWAAIAPCAGYPTLKGYGSADGLVPDTSSSPVGSAILRSANQSDVIKLATNYKQLGVYVFHGDSDRVVPVTYARQMKKVLADFHGDISYYEYPGGSHWFGDHSVDWEPLFDYFKWHKRLEDSSVNNIDFITFNPGISSKYRWASIYQQTTPLEKSHIQLKRNFEKSEISGATENIALLKLDLHGFAPGKELQIHLDSLNRIKYTVKGDDESLFLSKTNSNWSIAAAPDLEKKGPHRNGTLKDAFNHNMVFVYGTTGTKEENEWSNNKARYDAESWYYRGNGAVDLIPDHQYTAAKYKDRGVIIYGNKTTNSAWKLVLNDCPIQVERNKITAGDRQFSGDNYGAYIVWPNRNSRISSVAAITGSGLKGMNAASANQYFAGASGFPDYMIFTLDMLNKGVDGVEMAGFYDNDWKLKAD